MAVFNLRSIATAGAITLASITTIAAQGNGVVDLGNGKRQVNLAPQTATVADPRKAQQTVDLKAGKTTLNLAPQKANVGDPRHDQRKIDLKAEKTIIDLKPATAHIGDPRL